MRSWPGNRSRVGLTEKVEEKYEENICKISVLNSKVNWFVADTTTMNGNRQNSTRQANKWGHDPETVEEEEEGKEEKN